MASEWYLKVADRLVGPLTPQQLKAMADQGQVDPYDPVRWGNEGRWVPARSVRGLFSAEKASTTQGPSDGLPAAEQLKPPPVTPGAEVSDAASPTSAAPKAEPPPRPAAVPGPSGAPTVGPHSAPPAGVPVARPVDPAPPPPPAQISPEKFAVPPPADTPSVGHDGRAGKARAGPRRRRRQEAMLVAIIMAVLGLGTLTAVLLLSRKVPTAPSASMPAAEEAVASAPEPEAEKVVIPGLEEYLGGKAPEDPDDAESKAPPTEPKTPVAEPETPAAQQWTDASTSPIECGDVRVGITSARIGRPELVSADGKRASPARDYLCVKLELHNRSAGERELRSWGREQDGATLVDEDDHQYRLRSFADRGYTIVGQIDGGAGALPSGGSVHDLVVFDKPRQRVSRLRLELPAATFGEEGSLKFEIPISMIAVSKEAPEASSRSGDGRGESDPADQADAGAEWDRGPIAIPGIHDDQGAATEPEADDFRFAEDPERP